MVRLETILAGRNLSWPSSPTAEAAFSKDAKYEAERSTTPITLIDIDMLVGLLIQYYDNLDMDTRSLIPLVKIYWPA